MVPDRVAAAGYQQACTVHGEVLVGSERLELDGVGWRTHHWGDREWWDRPGATDEGPTAWAAGHFDDGGPPFFTTDLDVVAALWLVVSASLGGLGLSAAPAAHAPVAVPGAGGELSRLDRALCRFTAPDGRSATGWIEQLTRGA